MDWYKWNLRECRVRSRWSFTPGGEITLLLIWFCIRCRNDDEYIRKIQVDANVDFDVDQYTPTKFPVPQRTPNISLPEKEGNYRTILSKFTKKNDGTTNSKTFEDESNKNERWNRDQFGAFRSLFELLNIICGQALSPDDFQTRHQSIFPTRNRISIQDYNHNKPASYGILFKSINAVVKNFILYWFLLHNGTRIFCRRSFITGHPRTCSIFLKSYPWCRIKKSRSVSHLVIMHLIFVHSILLINQRSLEKQRALQRNQITQRETPLITDSENTVSAFGGVSRCVTVTILVTSTQRSAHNYLWIGGSFQNLLPKIAGYFTEGLQVNAWNMRETELTLMYMHNITERFVVCPGITLIKCYLIIHFK